MILPADNQKIYQHISGTIPRFDKKIWQDSAFCSPWNITRDTVDISAENSHYDKVIWPMKINDLSGERL